MSCHSCETIREGADGVTYSYAIIGVLCPACEWEAEHWWSEDEEARRKAALTPEEEKAEKAIFRWALASIHARNYWPRPGLQAPF